MTLNTNQLFQRRLEKLPARVYASDTPEDLSMIGDFAAAIWRRQPLPSFQAWIDQLPPGNLPWARMILPSNQVRDAIRQICDVSRTPDCPERELLIDDAAALADLFSSIMSARYIELRFDVVTNNACRKFHIDAVKARLICTYRGCGTQYTTSASATAAQQVETVPTGAAVILRGTLWKEPGRFALLHRSPPIEGTGQTRLVLVLDAAKDPGEAFSATHTAYEG